MRNRWLRGIRRRFQRLSPCHGQVAHVLRTLLPVAARVLLPRAAPRLACVRPAASVHPEPGSNSSLYTQFIVLSIPAPSFILLKRINALVFFVFKVLASLYFPSSIFKELQCVWFEFQTDCKDIHFFFQRKYFSHFFDFFCTSLWISAVILNFAYLYKPAPARAEGNYPPVRRKSAGDGEKGEKTEE